MREYMRRRRAAKGVYSINADCFGNRWLPQMTCADRAGSSGDKLGVPDRDLCFVADIRLGERIGAAPDHAVPVEGNSWRVPTDRQTVADYLAALFHSEKIGISN
jgi:hypothetical protein